MALKLKELIKEAHELVPRIGPIYEARDKPGYWRAVLTAENGEQVFGESKSLLKALRKAIDLFKKWTDAEKAKPKKRVRLESKEPKKRTRVRLKK